jgi:hypothetical protein
MSPFVPKADIHPPSADVGLAPESGHSLLKAMPAMRTASCSVTAAWYPVVVRFDKEFERRVWLEHLERKWSVGRYGQQKGHWRYRYPVVPGEQPSVIPNGSSAGLED